MTASIKSTSRVRRWRALNRDRVRAQDRERKAKDRAYIKSILGRTHKEKRDPPKFIELKKEETKS